MTPRNSPGCCGSAFPALPESISRRLAVHLGVHAGPGALVVGVQRYIDPEDYADRETGQDPIA